MNIEGQLRSVVGDAIDWAEVVREPLSHGSRHCCSLRFYGGK